ncbi:6738_t:CDS:2, partial [Funneliformis caledonium]
DCKEKKLKAFSLYKSLKEVLKKYGISSDGTDTIPLFSIDPRNSRHQQALRALYEEYFVQDKALRVFGDATRKEFSMRPEYKIIGDESCGRVDYAIKV